jgi:chromosome segregation ATPase
MLYLVAAICAVLCFFAAKGSVIAFQKSKFAAGGGAGTIAAKNAEIEKIGLSLIDLLQYENSYATGPQYRSLKDQLTSTKEVIAQQQAQLKQIETALTTAQKNVEEKEAQQQEVKTLKEEDEAKLIELLTAHETLSAEAISLESELAETLRNVEEMLKGTTLTEQEKEILNEFNETLFNASARLRDLMTEYSVVKERLEGLQGQFKDLEEEYTRLVEQQLGVT